MALTLLMVSFDSPEESPSTSPMLLSEVGSSEGKLPRVWAAVRGNDRCFCMAGALYMRRVFATSSISVIVAWSEMTLAMR